MNKLTPDDLECPEGGIHDFLPYYDTKDICVMVFCCSCVFCNRICCNCPGFGSMDPEADYVKNFSQNGRKPCRKCGTLYKDAVELFKSMTPLERADMWKRIFEDSSEPYRKGSFQQYPPAPVMTVKRDAGSERRGSDSVAGFNSNRVGAEDGTYRREETRLNPREGYMGREWSGPNAGEKNTRVVRDVYSIERSGSNAGVREEGRGREGSFGKEGSYGISEAKTAYREWLKDEGHK